MVELTTMHDEYDIVLTAQKIYNSDNSLQMLLDMERVLDSLDLYVFEHWDLGELLEGPNSNRHWVWAKFYWPEQFMPNPEGARRLLNSGIMVEFSKSKIKTPVKVHSYADFKPGTRIQKTKEQPIWVVEISVPKRLMSNLLKGSVELGGEDVDLSDLDKAYDSDLQKAGVSKKANKVADEQEQQQATPAAPAAPPAA